MLLNKTKFADMQEVKYRKLLLMRPAYILTFSYYPRYILMWFLDLDFRQAALLDVTRSGNPLF